MLKYGINFLFALPNINDPSLGAALYPIFLASTANSIAHQPPHGPG